MPDPIDVAVPVTGGDLNVARYGPPTDGGRVCVGIHGITASSRSFGAVAEQLPEDWTLLAVDLRGRGASCDLPGPYGMRAHAADIGRVLSHFEVEQSVIAGHSMGAYVATSFAEIHPEHTDRVILIDGGFALPHPAGLDPDRVIEAVIGPAIARLSMTFESIDAYFDFWRAHPAFGPHWNEHLEAYLRYDLTGEGPELRSRVAEDPVRIDGRELVVAPEVVAAIERVVAPMHLIRVNRGLMDEPGGLVPQALADEVAGRLANLDVTTVEGPNHYTLMMGSGAAAVAGAIAG
jgi:pimeloyl-ACP methyl ester carboxylesterase